jgi:hypothetical protein
MDKINIIQGNPNDGYPNAIVIPVPARVRNKKIKDIHLESSKELLNRYKLSANRYKEISSQKDEWDNGEINIVKDADFGDVNVEDEATDVNAIIKRIETYSRLIIFLPIKTREDKEINPYIYLSGLRALEKLISSNEDFIKEFKVINIPVFPTLMDSIPKIEEIFKQIDISINMFVCLGTN